MFCHQCGEKLIEESIYCINCGMKVDHENQILDSTEPESVTNTEVQPHHTNLESPVKEMPQLKEISGKKTSTYTSLFPYFIPIISLVIVAIFLIFIYVSEQKKNDIVLELQQSAETSALEGDFAEAISMLEEALDIRPDYDVLKMNLDEINRAQVFSNQLDAIITASSNQQFDDAESQLNILKEQLVSETSPLFSSFEAMITSEEEKIILGKIKQEIPTLTSVDALTSKLNELEALSTTESDNVSKEIIDKIVQLTNDEASDLFANGHLEEALNVLNTGLDYSSNNEQLLRLKNEIEQAIVALEEQAAQDDLHNRTAAVEVTYFDAVLEENGDITISGTLVSTATVPIYSLTVYLSVFDEAGNYLFEDVVFVEPYELNPGDEGLFVGVIEDVNQQAYIEIINITWYFDL